MPPKKGGGRKAGKGKAGPKGMSRSIPPGLVLSDLVKKEWKLGPVIGQGGFGYIHLGKFFLLFFFFSEHCSVCHLDIFIHSLHVII